MHRSLSAVPSPRPARYRASPAALLAPALTRTRTLGPGQAQAVGIAYYGFRNEQAASYASACVGFLTGHPGGAHLHISTVAAHYSS